MIRDRDVWISGYRVMWMLVMFDLPVVEKEERKAATAFRNYLLELQNADTLSSPFAPLP